MLACVPCIRNTPPVSSSIRSASAGAVMAATNPAISSTSSADWSRAVPFPRRSRAQRVTARSRTPHPHRHRIDPVSPPVTATERQQVLDQVIAGYREELARTPAAQAYLHQRGLDDATIAQLGIGYCSGVTPFPLFDRVRRAEVSGRPLTRVGRRDSDPARAPGGADRLPRVGRHAWGVAGGPGHRRGTVAQVCGLARRKGVVGSGSVCGGGGDRRRRRANGLRSRPDVGHPHGRHCWHLSLPDSLAQLRQAQRIFLALDNDLAGWTAAYALAPHLDDRAQLIVLPAKDLGELAQHPTGYARFLASWRQARPWHPGDGI